MDTREPRIHETAEVSALAEIGQGTKIWHHVQIREGARIGVDCILGKGTYVDFDVVIGNNVKIQNGAYLYHGLVVEDGVFVGPGAIFTNDKFPRAITPEGVLKGDSDWECGRTTIRRGASIGAGAILLPGVEVGQFAVVGAGAVVTSDVKEFSLVIGVPARHASWVCMCGHVLAKISGSGRWECPSCVRIYRVQNDEKCALDS